MVFNTIDEFRNCFRLDTATITDSECESHLETARQLIYLQIPQISEQFPNDDTVRNDAILEIVALAERYYAFGFFLKAVVFSERFEKIDQNILSVLAVSRGADTPSPLDGADWILTLGKNEIENAKALIRQCKPKPWITKRASPSASYWGDCN